MYSFNRNYLVKKRVLLNWKEVPVFPKAHE